MRRYLCAYCGGYEESGFDGVWEDKLVCSKCWMKFMKDYRFCDYCHRSFHKDMLVHVKQGKQEFDLCERCFHGGM
jgi:predicted amidophosphoribosyltransferase